MATILIHSLVFSPDSVSTAYLMSDLALGLEGLGHKVKVLTTTPHYNVEAGSLGRQPIREVWRGLVGKSELGGIPIWHVKMPQKGARVTARMSDYAWFHLASLLAGALLVGKYDIVIAPSPPLTIGVVAWLLGLMRGAPAVYNVQEVYPDFAVNQGLLRNGALLALMKGVERLVYARSKEIVTISEGFRQALLRRGVPARKVCVIPNFVDTELYRPLSGIRNYELGVRNYREDGTISNSPFIIPNFQRGGRFVALYGGNIGLSQDWEALLYAAQALRELPIEFVIAGDGARRGWLEGEVKRRKLGNVRLMGYQPREAMPYINAASDIGVIPMKKEGAVDTFPSKIYTIMACGKPAVVQAEAGTELRWIIEASGCGRVVQPGDARAYSEAIRKAYEERAGLEAEGERGRQFVAHRYSKEAVAQQYSALVQRLTRK